MHLSESENQRDKWKDRQTDKQTDTEKPACTQWDPYAHMACSPNTGCKRIGLKWCRLCGTYSHPKGDHSYKYEQDQGHSGAI